MYAVAAIETKTVKIGTRGSPLALAQAYMTRDKLQVLLGIWGFFYEPKQCIKHISCMGCRTDHLTPNEFGDSSTGGLPRAQRGGRAGDLHHQNHGRQDPEPAPCGHWRQRPVHKGD